MTDPISPLPWTVRARRLRRDQTDCEALLWSRLRNRRLSGCKFHRQFAIGSYIVDFVCQQHRLVIELDGGQHADRLEQDDERTLRLESQGFRVLRFWNSELIDNLAGVLLTIAANLKSQSERARGNELLPGGAGESSSPQPDPLPGGEGAGCVASRTSSK